ncbi:Flavin-containing monooxygenase [Thalictrum thalictroides]|uniref:Flavin-containing monooxygenase n=1 Tax=Thalictrum thalictroides TaxID=46969 RepID=A0A7J6WFM6_THATH|nr:Flavin-containing monooxygenase [Thalictrum thalictroides]
MAIDYEGVSDEEMVAWDLWGGTGNPINPKGRWNITIEDTQIESTKVNYAHSSLVSLPLNLTWCFVKTEAFDGKVIHSMDYSAMDDASAAKYIKGKRVAVVGVQKSALDIATECVMANGIEHPCTVIYKRAHWNFPDFFPWGVPLAFLYFNHFAEYMIHKPGEGLILSLLATLLSPLRWMKYKFVESYIRWKLPLKKFNMIPKHSWEKDFFACTIAITPEKVYHRVDEGNLILKKSTTFSFWKDGVVINDNNECYELIETYVVILATGYKGDQKLKNIFSSPTSFQKYIMGTSKSTVQLYRYDVSRLQSSK